MPCLCILSLFPVSVSCVYVLSPIIRQRRRLISFILIISDSDPIETIRSILTLILRECLSGVLSTREVTKHEYITSHTTYNAYKELPTRLRRDFYSIVTFRIELRIQYRIYNNIYSIYWTE
uniref:Secreted protein n=1 Tax=Cacopsylla melanoneura TaxID=428564 RepID=A0A8D9DRY8_9HEMI